MPRAKALSRQAGTRLERVHLTGLVSEEIQYVTQGACLGSVDFRVATIRAGNGRKLLVLNVEKFRQSTACCGELTRLEGFVMALGALPILMFHVVLLG